MAFRHGSDTVVTIDGDDISGSTNSTQFNDDSDMADVSCYGDERKPYIQGQGDGTVQIGGNYDDGATGAPAILRPLKAARAAVPFVFQPAGAGTGKPQSLVDVFVKSVNVSAPVADKVAWTATLQMSGDLNEAAQA